MSRRTAASRRRPAGWSFRTMIDSAPGSVASTPTADASPSSGSASVSSAVVVGASSGVGRAMAERLAERGSNLVIVARDALDLEATAADLRLRCGVGCHAVAQDIASPDWDVEALVKLCGSKLGKVDRVLVPAGG